MIREDFVKPALSNGEVLVRNDLFAVAPTIRNWLNDSTASYRGSIPIGGTIAGMAACEVVQSAHPAYPVGSKMVAMARWENWSVLRPDVSPVPPFPVPGDVTLADALGLYSPNSLTAYFGLLEVGRPLAGETIVVSGAAGSVGSLVCQIARNVGCRVIGIAGGPRKCQRLVEDYGVTAAIDYRREDVAARLAATCPDGIDLFFDNVGGDQLQAAADAMADHGRIVLCGQISSYDRPGGAPGPCDMMKLVYGRIRLEGFVVGDFVPRADAARARLRQWADEGRLTVLVDQRNGIEFLPEAFVSLFDGSNQGTVLVAA